MKHTGIILITALALVACGKDEIKNDFISFQTSVGYPVKAANTAYPQDLTFVSSAFFLQDGQTGRAGSSTYIDEETVSYQSPVWTTDKPYYWPNGGKLTFMSYSPAILKDNFSISSNGIASERAWNSELLQTDFMVADIRINQEKTLSGVPTVFHHMLSNLRFFLEVEGDIKIRVESISLTNIYTKGYFRALISDPTAWGALSPEWYGHLAADNISIFSTASATPQDADSGKIRYGDDYFAIPQTLSETQCIKVVYDVYNGNAWSGQLTKQIPLPDIQEDRAWEIDVIYNYILCFSSSDMMIDLYAEPWVLKESVVVIDIN